MKKGNTSWRDFIRLFVFSAVLALSISGCVGVKQRIASVKVSLVDISVQEVKLFETAFKIELRVFNVNDVPLNVKGVDCKFELSGNDFAFGVSDRPTKIPAYRSETIPVMVYSSMVDVVKSLMRLPGQDNLAYKISGRFHLAGDEPAVSTVPFLSEGKVSIDRLGPGF